MVQRYFHYLWLPMLYLNSMWNLLFTALFLQFAFNTLLKLYRSFTVFEKQIYLVSAFGYGFFGTVTKKVMTAMTKPPDFKSDSNDSDTSSLSRHKTEHITTKSHYYKPNINSKTSNLENKNIMHSSPINKLSIKTSSSLDISPSYPPITTPPLTNIS